MANENQDVFRSLLAHLRTMASQHGYASSQIIEDRVRNLLEITGFNPDLAAELYWEDFLANQQQNGRLEEEDMQGDPDAAGDNDQEEDQDDMDVDVALPPEANLAAAALQPPQPFIAQISLRKRRREESRPLPMGGGRNLQQEPQEQEPPLLLEPLPRMQPQPLPEPQRPARGNAAARQLPPELANDEHVANLVAQARESIRQLEDGNVAQMARRAVLALNDNACISDDEAVVGGVLRLVGKSDDGTTFKYHYTDIADTPSRDNMQKEKDDEGYLSDNDWMWESIGNSSVDPGTILSQPTDLLWNIQSSQSQGSGNNGSEQDASVVIADDEEEEKSVAGIPRTWLSAGFSLSTCGTGLALKPPSDDDIAYFASKEKGTGNTGNRFIPPPYHCRSITALLSVVTALIYNGVNVHDKNVSCSSGLESFQNLDLFDRKRQFDLRLADALAALLTIAARAALKRKIPALKQFKKIDHHKWQKIEKKLKLCPTCRWQQDGDGSNGPVRPLGVQSSDSNIQIVTSNTNIEDLRAYVLCNINAFKGPGGCALFLETLMHIHGKGTVARMIRQSRTDAGLSSDDMNLVHCKCDLRHNDKLQSCTLTERKAWVAEHNMDTAPLQADCLSTELLSLLLTGRVHSTLEGWTTGSLGIGILTETPGAVGCALTRPEKSTWVLCGPTCYSTLILRGTQDFPEQFSYKDRPGSIAHFLHWNCWYNNRGKTEFRLVTARPEWEPRVDIDTTPSIQSNLGSKKCLKRILERRNINMFVGSLRYSVEDVSADAIVREEEMDRVECHVEDQKLFPGRYQLWRYNFKSEDMKENHDRKLKAANWLPYHRLTDRQKLVVEHKLGPRINRLLWTRWPHAAIDRYDPLSPSPVV